MPDAVDLPRGCTQGASLHANRLDAAVAWLSDWVRWAGGADHPQLARACTRPCLAASTAHRSATRPGVKCAPPVAVQQAICR